MYSRAFKSVLNFARIIFHAGVGCLSPLTKYFDWCPLILSVMGLSLTSAYLLRGERSNFPTHAPLNHVNSTCPHSNPRLPHAHLISRFVIWQNQKHARSQIFSIGAASSFCTARQYLPAIFAVFASADHSFWRCVLFSNRGVIL